MAKHEFKTHSTEEDFVIFTAKGNLDIPIEDLDNYISGDLFEERADEDECLGCGRRANIDLTVSRWRSFYISWTICRMCKEGLQEEMIEVARDNSGSFVAGSI